ncbi:MAG: MFS transporter [Deltaproteobacteria bacterium]|jgi:MFS family permease|nr:MFS transporter [Deltaproteobacteria bacterium]
MKKRPFIFYGWFIVVAGIISYALGYGARYSFSVIFPSLLAEFQWPRDTTAVMLSVHLLVYGLVAPVAGNLVDRIGPRKAMVFGTMLLSLGLFLSGWGSKLWHFYLSFGVLCGAGLCFIGAVVYTTILRNWFEKKRGLAFSLMFFGAGGAFVWYPGIAFLIEHVGWQNTFFTQGIVLGGLMVPLIIFVIRYHPREKGLVADGGINTDTHSTPSETWDTLIVDHAWAAIDWTLQKAIKTRRFWLVCLAAFSMWGITQHIMVAHHVAFATDLGYSKIYASSVLSLFGIAFAFGSLAASVSDRIGRELTMTLSAIVGISGIVVLMLMKSSSDAWMLYYYAIAFGFGNGLSAPTIPAITTDIFQGPRVGSAIGFVWFSFAVGGAIGPWLGGWIFELVQDYEMAFGVAIGWYAVSAVAIWGASPRKVRCVPGQAGASQKS